MHKSLLIILLTFIIISPQQIIHAAREPATEPTYSSEPRTIPTTLNPTGNGLPGVRSIANPSFEDFDFPYTWASYATIAEEHMRGWYTTHPLKEEYYDNIKVSTTLHRLIEIQHIIPAHGTYHAELNAWFKSMVYQPICLSSGETFTYEFYHTSKPGNRTDIVEFRLGIPSGLPTGSRSADSYSRQIIVANTTTNASNHAISVTNNTVNHPIPSGTTLTSATIENNWGKYRGTHTLPASGWTGVYNLGFNAIAGATNELGNFLDGITIGLNPIVDFGSSRDTAGNESSSPPSINIRINGRVAANTKFMLQMAEGDATPDVDFTLGAVNAGAYGTATSVHVAGSNNWLITIPAGDYDGGVVPANNKGGLTIPVTYTSDSTIEPTEYMFFKLLFPGKLGSSTNWVLGDPTCDGSRKIDGVVYSIVDVGPTSTPVPTATLTPSRTPSPTFTLTPTNTNTPTFTPSRTPTPSLTPTLSPTFTTSPTFTITPTFTRTSTITPSPNPFALKDVAVGASFSMGVMHNGSLITWGFNRDGQASIPTWMRGVRIKEVEAGSNWVVVLTESGSVTGWGKNDFGQLTIPVAARSGVIHISAFYGHVIALKSNGTAVLWGRNHEKQLNMPAITYKLKDVSAGHTHTLAVTEDETIIGWGNPYLVQPKFIEPLGGIKAVSAGFDHSLALTNWGTVVCWRSTDPNPRNTQDVGQCDPIHKSLYNIVAISAGKQYSLALDKNGIVYAWGLNNRGQATVPKNAPRAAIIEAGYVNSVIGYQDASIRAIGESTHGSLITRTPTRTP